MSRACCICQRKLNRTNVHGFCDRCRKRHECDVCRTPHREGASTCRACRAGLDLFYAAMATLQPTCQTKLSEDEMKRREDYYRGRAEKGLNLFEGGLPT